MSSVFITLSNAKHIVMYSSELKNLDLKGSIYKKPINFFSKFEKNELFAFQELLKNPEKYFNNIYKTLVKEDTYTMVKEGLSPAYHCSTGCPKLNADYDNLKIPPIIRKELGIEGIKEARNIFAKREEHYLKNPDQFIQSLYFRYRDKPKIAEELINITQGNASKNYVIHMPNGGSTDEKNATLAEVENQIDKLLRDYQIYFRSNKKNQEILNQLCKWTYQAKKKEGIHDKNTTDYSDDEVTKVLLYFDAVFKMPLIKLLCQYYQLTINRDVKLPVQWLEQVGFKPCKSCHDNSNLEILSEEEHRISIENEPLPSPIIDEPGLIHI